MKLGLARGNHKGALNHSKDLQALLQKDVIYGYALSIHKTTATKIIGDAWTPLNIQEQWSINERGERIKKKMRHPRPIIPRIGLRAID